MKKIILFLLLFCQCLMAQTITNNWDVNIWSGTLLSQSYDIDPINSGNDISFKIAGNTSRLTFFGTSKLVTGGLMPVQNALRLEQDLNNRNQYNSLTMTFNYVNGVSDLKFPIYDIDRNSDDFIDKVTITGYRNGNPVYPSIIGSINNMVDNNIVYGVFNNLQTSGNANAYISFGSPVDSVYVLYNNMNCVDNNPTLQTIAFGDITYHSVPLIPEPEYYGLVILGLLGIVVLIQHRKNLPQK